jgi:hypothetical protein
MNSPITGKPMKYIFDEHKATSNKTGDVTFRIYYWLCQDSGEKFILERDEINLNNNSEIIRVTKHNFA